MLILRGESDSISTVKFLCETHLAVIACEVIVYCKTL